MSNLEHFSTSVSLHANRWNCLTERKKNMNRKIWQKLKCSKGELQLKATLTGGQSFRFFFLILIIVNFSRFLFWIIFSYRWKVGSLPEDNFVDESYFGVMANCVWQLRQTENELLYRVLGELKNDTENYCNPVRIKIAMPPVKKSAKKKTDIIYDSKLLHSVDYYESLLRAYFRLDVNLSECYAKWSDAHQHFKAESGKFYAIRVLDQDPVENLFSFICSQNNHISR